MKQVVAGWQHHKKETLALHFKKGTTIPLATLPCTTLT
jgi:hypothetical protein